MAELTTTATGDTWHEAAQGRPAMTDQPVTIPTCRLCISQGRTTPMFATASGSVICPICDRNIPHRPTPAQARHAKEKP